MSIATHWTFWLEVNHKHKDHISFHLQVRNDGGRDAYAALTVLVSAVTYNSLHRGECQRQTLSVTVPARTGQTSSPSHDMKGTNQSGETTWGFWHCASDHLVYKEVLRLHYDDYAQCVSDHRLIRVRALLEAAGETEAIMAVANIPLTMPQVLVEVGVLAFETHCTLLNLFMLNSLGIKSLVIKCNWKDLNVKQQQKRWATKHFVNSAANSRCRSAVSGQKK